MAAVRRVAGRDLSVRQALDARARFQQKEDRMRYAERLEGLADRIEDLRLEDASSAFDPVVDLVADASMDSFPASDPPSWGGMRLGPPE